jgi:hypothetical protein
VFPRVKLYKFTKRYGCLQKRGSLITEFNTTENVGMLGIVRSLPERTDIPMKRTLTTDSQNRLGDVTMGKSQTPSHLYIFELKNYILLTDYFEVHKLGLCIFIWIKIRTVTELNLKILAFVE